MSRIRVALAGIGNCASALVQGIAYYGDRERALGSAGRSGLMRPSLGGFRPSNVEIVGAFPPEEVPIARGELRLPIEHLLTQPAV